MLKKKKYILPMFQNRAKQVILLMISNGEIREAKSAGYERSETLAT